MGTEKKGDANQEEDVAHGEERAIEEEDEAEKEEEGAAAAEADTDLCCERYMSAIESEGISHRSRTLRVGQP